MATKKSSPKKSAAKKAPVKTRSKVSVRKAVNQSFRLVKSDTPFMTFRVDRQTVYWTVLGLVIIMFSLWIARLQTDIQTIYDKIDANDAATQMLVLPKKHN